MAQVKGCAITKDELREYDERIGRYTRQIGEKRGGLKLKYFQYVALLFTEMYLDRYFANREQFCDSLNEFIAAEYSATMGTFNIEPYSLDKMK